MTQRQRPDEALVRLRREVLPPRDPSSSLGIIAVSTVALLFALSSSLLLFHASAIQRCPGCTAVTSLAPMHPSVSRPPAPPRLARPALDRCAGPSYRALASGAVEVVFELCEPRAALKRVVLE